jgi:hypothetical protein
VSSVIALGSSELVEVGVEVVLGVVDVLVPVELGVLAVSGIFGGVAGVDGVDGVEGAGVEVVGGGVAGVIGILGVTVLGGAVATGGGTRATVTTA